MKSLNEWRQVQEIAMPYAPEMSPEYSEMPKDDSINWDAIYKAFGSRGSVDPRVLPAMRRAVNVISRLYPGHEDEMIKDIFDAAVFLVKDLKARSFSHKSIG